MAVCAARLAYRYLRERERESRVVRYADRRSRCWSNTARRNRRVGETFRYFTIILPPTVVDAAKSEKRKESRKEQEREREREGECVRLSLLGYVIVAPSRASWNKMVRKVVKIVRVTRTLRTFTLRVMRVKQRWRIGNV